MSTNQIAPVLPQGAGYGVVVGIGVCMEIPHKLPNDRPSTACLLETIQLDSDLTIVLLCISHGRDNIYPSMCQIDRSTSNSDGRKQNRYTKYSTKGSEEFNTASRSIKSGLIAAGIVSAWTWAATLLQSSTVAYQYGIAGPFWVCSLCHIFVPL